MARPLRIEYPGALYHVTSSGNRQEAIFDDDQDRSAFLNVLDEVISRFRWRCYAYCLMGNHYHLMIETPEANLTKGMRHPKVQQRGAAPKLSVIRGRQKDRDDAIRAAYETGAYSYQQIAKEFGVHFTTVGRIVRQPVNQARAPRRRR
jgi:REP element-mobilizing transposase RayT